MSDDELLIVAAAGLGLWWFTHERCAGPGSCACSGCAPAPATGVPPAPGTGTLLGPQPSLAKQLCEAGAKAGAAAGASAAGIPPSVGTAAATPGLTSTLCTYLGKGLVAAEHGVVTAAKDVGKAGAATGKFIGHTTATAAKATAHVTVTAVKDVGKAAGKVGGALEGGAKGAAHAVSSGVHKVLGWL